MTSSDSSNDSHPKSDEVIRRRSTPHCAWICGFEEFGKCCQAGPTRDGRCGRIINVTGSPNGTTQDDSQSLSNLPPCVPKRSHWYRMRSMRLNVAIFTGGLLLLCLTIPQREKLFVPGPLSDKHSQILENTLVSQRCSLCHTETEQFLKGFQPSNVLSTLVANDGRQDELCLKCHKEQMPTAVGRNPHDLSPEVWDELNSQRQKQAAILVSTTTSKSGDTPSSNSKAPDSKGSESKASESNLDKCPQQCTSCASCHVEHRGAKVSLVAMSDERCQACHQRKFQSLASGHPEFTDFPVDRPRSLKFSHDLHFSKHFPTKNRTFECRECHLNESQPELYGPISRSVSFEKACASCHDQPIRAATTDGWAAISLPSLDASAISANEDLKRWPAGARSGFEGKLSPVLRALLEADLDASQALQLMPLSSDIKDVAERDNQRREVSLAIARAVERLIIDTAANGQDAWQKRLAAVLERRLGRAPNEQDKLLISAMCSGLPPDLFRDARTKWFQAQNDAEQTVPAANSLSSANSTSARARLVSAPQSIDDLLPANSKANTPSGDLLQDELLNNSASQESDDSLLSNPSSIEGDSDLPLPGELKKSRLKATQHLSSGGWYRDDETLSIRYVPNGHADPVLAAWSAWWILMEQYSEPQTVQNIAKDIFAEKKSSTEFKTVSEQVPGGCITCHSLANLSDMATLKSWQAPWKAIQRSPSEKEFTKFDHRPHLKLPAVSDCRHCHKLNGSGRKIESPEYNREPSGRFVTVPAQELLKSLRSRVGNVEVPLHSEFESIHLEQCAACHRPGGANSGCLQCHNYHITSPPNNSSLRR